MEQLPIKIRELRDGDVSFILATWKTTLREAQEYKWVPKAAYFAEVNRRLDPLVERSLKVGDPMIMIACSPFDDDQIVGWLCFDKAVHYCFVKEPFRQQQVASRMMIHTGFLKEGLEIPCTHWSRALERIAETYPLRYTPSKLDKHKQLRSSSRPRGFTHEHRQDS